MAYASPIKEPDPESRYDWPVCNKAEQLLLGHVDEFLSRNPFARRLADRMREETGTRLLDWVDHLVLPHMNESPLRKAGFGEDGLAEAEPHFSVMTHPAALLPRVLLERTPGVDPLLGLAIRVESLEQFIAVHQLSATPAGAPWSRYRRVIVATSAQTQLEAVERRGYRGFVAAPAASPSAEALLEARQLWQQRRRLFEDEAAGYQSAHQMLDQLLHLVGRDLACHVVFEGERQYWQQRNRAAQIQKVRQDALGLGWANHDHHTFRSSRVYFLDLMRVMEKLGFERRERYYAGEQAGWGAQILEQPMQGIVVFADLDLMPWETRIDFSREPLAPTRQLGTVGLWVGLHGESFLGAGMHHLEARFDFTLVREQLKKWNINGMAPFSDFDFLKQGFTEGERWPVARHRAERLLRDGLISQEQFREFVAEGAIGSHLETLQRRGGFKGFNQKSVSAIIAATDPRKQQRATQLRAA